MPALVVAAVVLGGGCASQPSGAPAVPEAGSTTPTTQSVSGDVLAVPVRLAVPSIAVDERLIDLGIAGDGTMEVPERAGDAGWLTTSGRPGGRGPIVIAGHVDGREGPGVFFRLTEVPVGAVVSVQTEDGGVAEYRVTRVADFPKSEFPTESVFGTTIGDELRLITCTGEFDTDARSYRANRIVFAVRV